MQTHINLRTKLTTKSTTKSQNSNPNSLSTKAASFHCTRFSRYERNQKYFHRTSSISKDRAASGWLHATRHTDSMGTTMSSITHRSLLGPEKSSLPDSHTMQPLFQHEAGLSPTNTTRSHLIKSQVSSSACMNRSFVHGQHCNGVELECVSGWRWETEPITGMELAVFFGPVRTLLCWPEKG